MLRTSQPEQNKRLVNRLVAVIEVSMNIRKVSLHVLNDNVNSAAAGEMR